MTADTKQFIVEMRCVVTKSVVCECETEEQARSDPWEWAVDERETEQVDWTILKVTEDKP